MLILIIRIFKNNLKDNLDYQDLNLRPQLFLCIRTCTTRIMSQRHIYIYILILIYILCILVHKYMNHVFFFLSIQYISFDVHKFVISNKNKSIFEFYLK